MILTTPYSAKADSIRYMSHAESSLASFLDIINNAKKSIDLTTFIFEPCHASAQVIIDAMITKARSGVKVRILLDRFMQDKKQVQNIVSYLEENGIEIRWFNTGLLNINFRSHIKLIVVDARTYISGGRNIADDYFSLYDGANFIDRDAYVSGASAKEAQKVFNDMWTSKWTSQIKAKKSSLSWAEFCGIDESARIAEIKEHFRKNMKGLVASLPTRSCDNTQFIADAPGAKILDQHQNPIQTAIEKKKYATAEFLKFIRGTKKRLVLENWSIMPHEHMSYELFNLRWYKIPVVVLTNDNMDGPGILKYAEDSFNNRAARRQNKGSVTVKQISMHGDLQDAWLITPAEAEFRLHGKVGVRDDKDVMISSFNIDQRSYNLNMESMVLVKDCPALANDLNDSFVELLSTHRKDLKAGIPKNDSDNALWTILGALGSSFF